MVHATPQHRSKVTLTLSQNLKSQVCRTEDKIMEKRVTCYVGAAS